MRRLPLADGHERPDICGPCGGKCCKAAPGIATPEDVGAPNRVAMRLRVEALLRTGEWAIDWWEGNPSGNQRGVARRDGFYLRPATVTARGDVFDPSYGGTCVFLGEDGCRLGDERPTGCREVVPQEDRHCGTDPPTDTKRVGAVRWWPYAEMLQEAGRRVREEQSA